MKIVSLNGLVLAPGENRDYIIDKNGELDFSSGYRLLEGDLIQLIDTDRNETTFYTPVISSNTKRVKLHKHE